MTKKSIIMETIILFNRVYLTGKEQGYILDSLNSRRHCGNHSYGQKCISYLNDEMNLKNIFLTPSCTSAMEMGAMLADLGPGDEVILPSYTFSSTANAITIRGAHPVFCEICPETMNIDVSKIEQLITAKTKMILPIDYAGIPCEIDQIMQIAKKHKLVVMQDAAQSIGSKHKGEFCGTVPDIAAFSFHETKNLSCGEGGALTINNPDWLDRAHFLQEKGTDRSLVLKGIKSKYSWVDIGSSFLLSDLNSAMLLAQLEDWKVIGEKRSVITKAYNELFSPYAEQGMLKIPIVPDYSEVNHHAFFVIFDTEENKDSFLSILKEKNVYPYIGYLPLHSSPMGQKLGYKASDLPITENLASRIVRLPFYVELVNDLEYCIDNMSETLKTIYK